MNRGWKVAALILVFVGLGAVIAWHETRSPPTSAPRLESAAEHARVLLFADPREAEATCGCGLIFHAVREAASGGVVVREVDPEHEAELVRAHRVAVEPTVIFLDESGRETARHEGESSETIAAIEADLARLRSAQ